MICVADAPKRVAILISGGGSNMVALVQSMTGDHPARACGVVADLPDAGGLRRAADLGVYAKAVDRRPFGADRAGFERALQDQLTQLSPDIICLAGFMRVLSAEFLAPWAGRILNIHPSLLPKHKGLHTHQRALDGGDVDHGCTVHEVTPALDDGPILGQARLAIHPGDTPERLAARVLRLEHRLYPQVLRNFAQGHKTPIFITA